MENEPSGVEEKPQLSQEAEGAPPAAGPRLFGRTAVVLASLVGSPVAGGILLAMNAARLRKWGGAALALFMGLLLTYSLLGLMPHVPGYLGLVLLPVGAAVMAWVVGALQGDVLAAHAKAGGRAGGMATALVVGLVTVAGLYGVLRAIQPAKPAGVPLVKVTVTENQSVNYAPPVTEDEARRVGRVLEGVGYFDKSGTAKEVVVGADRDGRRVVVFPVDPAHAKDQQVVKAFALVAQQMVRAGVPLPFSIRLVGPGWKTVNEFKVEISATTRPGGAGGPAARPLSGEGAASRPVGLGPSGLP